jgi:hypothetical protein
MPFVSEECVELNRHAKSLTRQLEGGQIIQAVSVDTAPTKDIHNIVDEGSSMTLTGRGSESDTL